MSVEGATDPGCRSDESGETDLPHAGEELGQAAEAEGHADDDIGVLQVISRLVSGRPQQEAQRPEPRNRRETDRNVTNARVVPREDERRRGKGKKTCFV
jgi:hypothetical protein